jgi:hypothetical protein
MCRNSFLFVVALLGAGTLDTDEVTRTYVLCNSQGELETRIDPNNEAATVVMSDGVFD